MKSDHDLLQHLPYSIEGWIDVLRFDGAKAHQQSGATRRPMELVETVEADFDTTGEVAEVLYVD
jgi:hypothetical protein